MRRKKSIGMPAFSNGHENLLNPCALSNVILRMPSLYLSMTEKLSAHWKAHANAYPQKFLMTRAQHAEYVRVLKLCGSNKSDFFTHMGVPIEIAEDTPGLMVAADGVEVSLL